MRAQVQKMMGRFQKTGLQLFNQATKALAIPTVQYAIGAILVLYMTFLESENDSVLSVAMMNPLGRLLVLLFLLLLTSVSVPLGILFAVLVVMSSANRENFAAMDLNALLQEKEASKEGMADLPPVPEDAKEGFGGFGSMYADLGRALNANSEDNAEENFASMSPDLKESEDVEGFCGPELGTV